MQRDYILRMIEQIGQALIRIRMMILGGTASAEAIEGELQTTARGFGVDLDMARMATADTLVLLISTGGEVDPSKCWILAELLFLDALESEARGNIEAAATSFDKALQLFSLLRPGGGFLVGWPEAAERIAEIRSRRPERPGA